MLMLVTAGILGWSLRGAVVNALAGRRFAVGLELAAVALCVAAIYFRGGFS